MLMSMQIIHGEQIIFEIGTTLGLGAFRLMYGDATWRNPKLGGNLDSMVVDLLDTTYESPKFRIAYWGWKITPNAKINVFWTISTKKEMRSTMCELVIEGKPEDYEKIKVVVGMTKPKSNSGTSLTLDSLNRRIITLGKQSQQGDSLLLAMYAHPAYFSGFSTSNSANYAMILKLNKNHKAKWSFMYSWAKEPSPLFRETGWQSKLFKDLPAPEEEDTLPSTGTFPIITNHSKITNSQVSLRRGILLDVQGRIVRGELPSILNLSDISSGIYFFKGEGFETINSKNKRLILIP